MTFPLKRIGLAAMFLMIAASCGGGGTPLAEATPSPVEGALGQGLIAYVAGNGLGVLDPTTGKSTLVSPLPAAGAFTIAGPVWAPAPGISYPVLYFTIHETRDAPRVVTYDCLFRHDPFAGTIAPLAASYDF